MSWVAPKGHLVPGRRRPVRPGRGWKVLRPHPPCSARRSVLSKREILAHDRAQPDATLRAGDRRRGKRIIPSSVRPRATCPGTFIRERTCAVASGGRSRGRTGRFICLARPLTRGKERPRRRESPRQPVQWCRTCRERHYESGKRLPTHVGTHFTRVKCLLPCVGRQVQRSTCRPRRRAHEVQNFDPAASASSAHFLVFELATEEPRSS